MKKNLFFAAVAAIAFASCANDDLLVDDLATNEKQVEIGFDTYAESQTRAENNGTDYTWNLEDHHLTFDVWSTKQVAGNFVAVHGDGAADNAGIKVTSDGSTPAVWVPTARKYWDKAATLYRFYAAAPSSSTWKIKNAEVTPATDPVTYTENYENAYLTYANATLTGVNIADATYSTTLNNSWKGKADVDLMIAAPCEKTGISAITATNQTVTLQFNHILSRLNVAFKKSTNLDDAKVVVTDFQVCNLVSKGSFDESKATAVNTTPGSLARWTPSTTATDIVDILGVHTTAELSSTDAYYTVQSLVIPQNVAFETIERNGTNVNEETSKPYVYVEYTIDNEPYFAYINLAAAFGMDGTIGKTSIAFNEGWQNNLTVTLDALEILFDATVSEWSTNLEKTIVVE